MSDQSPILEAIRQRADAATPGPWNVGSEHPKHGDVMHPWEVIVSDQLPMLQLEPDRNGANDAAFIANARTDIPALLAHVAFLEREIGKLDAQRDELGRAVRDLIRESTAGDSRAVQRGREALGKVPPSTLMTENGGEQS